MSAAAKRCAASGATVPTPGPAIRGETVADVIIGLGVANAATFRLEPCAQRNLHDVEARAVVRVTLDGWAWFLSPGEARMIAIVLSSDAAVLGSPTLRKPARQRLAALIAKAFIRAARDAEALARQRSAEMIAGNA